MARCTKFWHFAKQLTLYLHDSFFPLPLHGCSLDVLHGSLHTHHLLLCLCEGRNHSRQEVGHREGVRDCKTHQPYEVGSDGSRLHHSTHTCTSMLLLYFVVHLYQEAAVQWTFRFERSSFFDIFKPSITLPFELQAYCGSSIYS